MSTLYSLYTLIALLLPHIIYAKVITLPEGVRVEGVTHARGTNFFAGDINTGRILLVDVESELITTAVPASSRSVTGMYATAPGRLFAGGGGPSAPFRSGSTGSYLHVYNIVSGSLIASCGERLNPGMVNDVVADREYAYYTDSFRGSLYRLTIAALPRCEVKVIDLGDDFKGQGFQANGIVSYRSGLIVANTARGTIFFVDLRRANRVTQIVPDGSIMGVDGLAVTRIEGKVSLYVTQNRASQVSVWNVLFDGKTRLVTVELERVIKRPSFRTPSTSGVGGGYLVTTNIDFTVPLNSSGPFTLTVRKI